MRTCNAENLCMSDRHYQMLMQLLQWHAPGLEVWAYGSRVNGEAHEASDLDLILRNPKDLTQRITNLAQIRSAFMESYLPIRVDILDWAVIPESFHKEIEREYIILKSGENE